MLRNNAFFAFLLSLNFESHGRDLDEDDFEIGRPDLFQVFNRLTRRNEFIDSQLTRA